MRRCWSGKSPSPASKRSGWSVTSGGVCAPPQCKSRIYDSMPWVKCFWGQAGRGGLTPRPTDAPGRLAPFQTSDEKISIGDRRIVGGDVSNLGAAKSCALRSVAYLIHSQHEKASFFNGDKSNCEGVQLGQAAIYFCVGTDGRDLPAFAKRAVITSSLSSRKRPPRPTTIAQERKKVMAPASAREIGRGPRHQAIALGPQRA